MGARDAEYGAASSILLSCLGWYDFYRTGHAIHAMIGSFGIFVLLIFICMAYLDSDAEDETPKM